MSLKDSKNATPGVGERWSGHVRHFGLTQEQTQMVPAVWRRRRERQRQWGRQAPAMPEQRD